MFKLFLQSLRLTIVFTVLMGVAYPLVVTALAQLAFYEKAHGSLVRRDGQVIGSALLAQKFESPRYFWPRPSSCGFGAMPSSDDDPPSYSPVRPPVPSIVPELDDPFDTGRFAADKLLAAHHASLASRASHVPRSPHAPTTQRSEPESTRTVDREPPHDHREAKGGAPTRAMDWDDYVDHVKQAEGAPPRADPPKPQPAPAGPSALPREAPTREVDFAAYLDALPPEERPAVPPPPLPPPPSLAPAPALSERDRLLASFLADEPIEDAGQAQPREGERER